MFWVCFLFKNYGRPSLFTEFYGHAPTVFNIFKKSFGYFSLIALTIHLSLKKKKRIVKAETTLNRKPSSPSQVVKSWVKLKELAKFV